MTVRIVHNKLLGGWYVVRGPHDTPISGRFDSKAEAKAWLEYRKAQRDAHLRVSGPEHAARAGYILPGS